MNKLTRLLLLSFAVITTLVSCKKDSESTPNVPVEEQIPVQSIALKTNGTDWASNSSTSIGLFGFGLPGAGVTLQGNSFILTGVQTKGTDTTFFVLIKQVTNPANLVGEYPVSFAATSLISLITTGGGNFDPSLVSNLAIFGKPKDFSNINFNNQLSLLGLLSLGSNGTLKITKHDTSKTPATVSGTFSWNQTGTTGYAITEGRFNQIPIQ